MINTKAKEGGHLSCCKERDEITKMLEEFVIYILEREITDQDVEENELNKDISDCFKYARRYSKLNLIEDSCNKIVYNSMKEITCHFSEILWNDKEIKATLDKDEEKL